LAVILNSFDLYQEGVFSPRYGYIYIAFITNTSVTVSMYCLVLFYIVTKEELAPYNPVAKVLCIKAILFFSFWQSVILSGLAYFEVIQSVGAWSKDEVTTALNDFAICIEMFLLSLLHPMVFSWKPYIIVGEPKKRKMKDHVKAVKNFGHVINQKDLIVDIKGAYHPKQVKNAKKGQSKIKKDRKEKAENEMKEDDEEMKKTQNQQEDQKGDNHGFTSDNKTQSTTKKQDSSQSSESAQSTHELSSKDSEDDGTKGDKSLNDESDGDVSKEDESEDQHSKASHKNIVLGNPTKSY